MFLFFTNSSYGSIPREIAKEFTISKSTLCCPLSISLKYVEEMPAFSDNSAYVKFF